MGHYGAMLMPSQAKSGWHKQPDSIRAWEAVTRQGSALCGCGMSLLLGPSSAHPMNDSAGQSGRQTPRGLCMMEPRGGHLLVSHAAALQDKTWPQWHKQPFK
jgi:hypothetical protein